MDRRALLTVATRRYFQDLQQNPYLDQDIKRTAQRYLDTGKWSDDAKELFRAAKTEILREAFPWTECALEFIRENRVPTRVKRFWIQNTEGMQGVDCKHPEVVSALKEWGKTNHQVE